MFIILSAMAFKKFSIRNLKGKNVTIKKSINLFILLRLSAYLFCHIIQTNGGLQGTKHVYVQYEILHNKIDVIIVIEPYHSSFLQAEMFYLLYFMENRHYSWQTGVLFFPKCGEQCFFLLIYYTMLSNAKNEILHILFIYLKDIRQLRFQTDD